ncbi:MAG TPA: shikimate kinase [Sulfurihydrogenibium sp.]|uniref:Shikimate kinase n=1 Tax=Sulfurihydrogenibium sp. (strain YO3AOP1) TaxID=436114 RepID=AROK_SULSY|nr:shikimate kinase [Sulfurihydrogenibium sp. YO3AOP1]B2V895.1 RecName: Full=Shikimate kinase; Short=SK [Sulfurihydrogenibium sp. YO3AOP1]ACD66168.1 Shikimate kinase [Sulfurihydrogenibium sp. YO3AOP1]HBT99146.1 shikimate kinase [Sulfurihydrogenibium sp.]
MKNIYLVGFMGSGKSTVGKILAEKLNMKFVDIDKLIEEKEGMKIKDIFEQKGESYFRELERKQIEAIVNQEGLVVSTGGGLGANLNNMNLMKKNGDVVWLDVSLNTVLDRLKNDQDRPLLKQPIEKIKQLFEERKNVYRLANIRINADKKTPSQIVEEILTKIKRR